MTTPSPPKLPTPGAPSARLVEQMVDEKARLDAIASRFNGVSRQLLASGFLDSEDSTRLRAKVQAMNEMTQGILQVRQEARQFKQDCIVDACSRMQDSEAVQKVDFDKRELSKHQQASMLKSLWALCLDFDVADLLSDDDLKSMGVSRSDTGTADIYDLLRGAMQTKIDEVRKDGELQIERLQQQIDQIRIHLRDGLEKLQGRQDGPEQSDTKG